MALPTSGPLSLFAIFKEIYGREPNIGERVSFHDLVQRSNLADKSFPCPFSRFYGYRHTALEDNTVTLRYTGRSGTQYTFTATAAKPVQSNVQVRFDWWVGSINGFGAAINLIAGTTSGSVTINANPTIGHDTVSLYNATVAPAEDAVYRYVLSVIQPVSTNFIAVGASMQQGSGVVTVNAQADKPVASALTITGNLILSPSSANREFTITFRSGYQGGSTTVSVSTLEEAVDINAASVFPTSDSTYHYEISF